VIPEKRGFRIYEPGFSAAQFPPLFTHSSRTSLGSFVFTLNPNPSILNPDGEGPGEANFHFDIYILQFDMNVLPSPLYPQSWWVRDRRGVAGQICTLIFAI